MSILLPTLGIAFAAFCVWLTVRIINRQERWAKWTLAGVIGFPVLYVASFGPTCWLVDRQFIPGRPAEFVFRPMVRVVDRLPWTIKTVFIDYSRIGSPYQQSMSGMWWIIDPDEWDLQFR